MIWLYDLKFTFIKLNFYQKKDEYENFSGKWNALRTTILAFVR